jgi:UDP-N-acetylglucosamine 4-epimerase
MTDIPTDRFRYQFLQPVVGPLRRSWLVTGAAGFIGSHLVEALLQLGQDVVGLDNLSTGKRANLQSVRESVDGSSWEKFRFIEGDITDPSTCRNACRDIHIVLHQAALGSVPRSIADPLATNASNITGQLNMLVAARDAGVQRFVYAASSSTYGDHPALPKVEENIGQPLSPYAVTKYVNELYASVFSRQYGMATVGLRYFNIFGRRQDPLGPYAAVIPLWISQLVQGQPCFINGDGETSRDFCHVANAVQANLRAACTENQTAMGEVFNVSVGGRTTLNTLFELLRDRLAILLPLRKDLAGALPAYRDFRAGDVRHSQASIAKAQKILGYAPTHDVAAGLDESLPWYVQNLNELTVQSYTGTQAGISWASEDEAS